MAEIRIEKGVIQVKSALLQRLFRVTHQQISEYVKAGMPGSVRAWFDLEASHAWYWERKQAELARQLESLDWKDQEVRLKRARADRQEMDNEVARGALLKAGEVVEHYGRLVAAYRARTLAIGANLAPRVLSCKTITEAKEMIDKETWEALNELSRDTGLHRDNASDHLSASKVDRKPVGRRKSRAQSRVKRKNRPVAD